ncbi:MAG TPA: ribulose-phosphate 3-epimerase [Pseudoclavibacter sp.]|nr:ribulose-phosphate 3-epimerase [Pseudoclavibacter sp.]
MFRINPSILSCDFANFEHALHQISSADMAHVDVMDNHFVPNLTFGLPVVRRLQEVSPIPLDVHLMIDDPLRWAPGYAQAGCASVTFHVEAASGRDEVVQVARALRSHGARAGIALKPATDPEPYLECLDEFDQILVMTVEPGFGGQSFMADMMPKLRRVSAAVAHGHEDISVQVDGGISTATICEARDNGANCFVAGSAVYNGADPARAISELRQQLAG